MPRRVRSDRMDEAEIWCCDCYVLEPLDVGLLLAHPSVKLTDRIYFRLVTLFLYMVAELSALQQIINALTRLNGLPAVIVQCTVTTIYTCEYALFHESL